MKKPNRNRIADRLRDLARIYEPYLSPSDWCERNIILPPGKNEAKPGRIDWKMTPYLRQILDCLEDPAVKEIVFIAPTRSGKTLLLRLGIACTIAKTPAPMLLFDSTIEKGRALVRKEVKPLINYNALLAARKPKNRAHYGDAHMLFPGASLDVYGANSAAGAAGDTATRAFGNECGKWKSETDKEASMIELIKHRVESAEGEGKIYLSTTPTTEESEEWQEFMLGDQCKFQVPCPFCGAMQELVWTQVRWPEDAQITEGEWDYRAVQAGAYYLCPHCAAHWTDADRLRAVQDPRATFVPTTQAKLPGVKSFQINGLYGPLQSNRLGDIAVSFLASRRTGWFASRRDFWNSRMGEPYRDTVSTITADKFRALMAPYARGTLPAGFVPEHLIIAVDVQTFGLPWVALAFDANNEKRTVDHGTAQHWSDIDIVQEGYAHLAKESFVIIDTGFAQRSPETLEAIFARRDRGWLGADGFEQSRNLTQLSTRDPFIGTRQEGAAQIPVLLISTYEFKVEWEKMFIRDNDTWRTYTLPEHPDGTMLAEQTEYFKMLLDEHRVPRKHIRPGKSAWEWKSKAGNNHAFDCHVYALALRYHLSRSQTVDRVKAAAIPRIPKRIITAG